MATIGMPPSQGGDKGSALAPTADPLTKDHGAALGRLSASEQCEVLGVVELQGFQEGLIAPLPPAAQDVHQAPWRMGGGCPRVKVRAAPLPSCFLLSAPCPPSQLSQGPHSPDL